MIIDPTLKKRLSNYRAKLTYKPIHAKMLSNYLAKIAPGYFASKLKHPFFIIGCARGGTTLLVDTLAAHNEIASYPDEANELWHPQTFPWRYSKHRAYIPPIEVNPERFTELSLKYRAPSQVRCIKAVFGAYQLVMGKARFLNKSAMITFMIPFVLEQFPNVKFIHLVRDGRAVALSWAKKEHIKIEENLDLYSNQGFGISFEELLKNCAESWKRHIFEVERQKKALELDKQDIMYELRYEDFCLNPHEYLREIADFMDISPQFFDDRDYSHIVSRNYKFREELDEDDYREVCQITEPALKEKGYL